MKKTALHQKHIELGAKMVPFGGYEMPVYYGGIVEEHMAVRKQAGIFDISHMGEFFVNGPKAKDLLQYATANDVDQLEPGKVQYSYMPNLQGGIVDDLVIYQLDQDAYMLVVNASNIKKDLEWLQKLNRDFGAELIDRSDEYCLIALQGPQSPEILKEITDIQSDTLKFYTFGIGSIAGEKDLIISATGYTGSRGFEIYCTNEQAPKIWDALMEAGKSKGIKPCGLGARDTLRLEAGLLLYGSDMDDSSSPYSVRLGWVTKLDKPFAARDIIKEQKEKGVKERIVGLETDEKIVPRHGYPVLDKDDSVVGVVTSGTRSPILNKAIAMALIKKEHAGNGNDLYVQVRKKKVKTKVVKLPFYKEQQS